jgi:hypothetical protein
MTKTLLEPKVLAERWHMSTITLKQWRWKGWGPQYIKLNRRVVYRLADIELYEKTKRASLTSQITKPLSLTHSADFSSVCVGGETFLFRGTVQQRIIELLYKAWASGSPRVRTQLLLEEAEAKSRQLRHIFKGHSNWKQLVGYEQGYCWLKL